MQINSERLWKHLHDFAQYGIDENGGLTLWPFTPEEMKAKDWIAEKMKEAGLIVHEDEVGNLIGVYNPNHSTLAPVLSGSHYDTVISGGIFDGRLGLFSALEVAQTFHENKIELKRPIYVIGYKDEEGNRFNHGMIGSKVITGKVQVHDFEVKDKDGISIGEAMKQWGYHPENYRNAQISPIHASVEVHIEQGKVLEKNNHSVGIVEGIPYLRFNEITISGCSGHAGATPMNDRLDPVVAMSQWITKMTELAASHPYTVATIGNIKTVPGSVNVICDHVTFTLDIRSLVDENIDQCLSEIKNLEQELTAQGLTIHYELRHLLEGVTCDERHKSILEEIMQARNFSYQRLMSGAGHDSQNFKDVCPCSMIFVRSENGYSHRKEEFSSQEDCAQGANALLDMIFRLCSEVSPDEQ